MFLDNKYTKLYMKLTSCSDTNQYTEEHHIIPSSMGGSNDPSNLIRLSARKHFLCHYLLIKMIEPKSPNWYKMVKGFAMMGSTSEFQQRYFNSRLYQTNRINFSLAMSKSQTGQNNSQFGTKWMHKDKTNIKCKSSEVDSYLLLGFSLGKYKKPSIPKLSMIQIRRNEEKEFLKSFLKRYLNGESLRKIAPDYGKSVVSLHLRLKFHFQEELKNVKQGSLKR